MNCELVRVGKIGSDEVETFRPFAEVDRPRRDEHAYCTRQTDHLAAFSAPMIALTIATSAPDHTCGLRLRRTPKALELQRPLPDDALRTSGEKEDGVAA